MPFDSTILLYYNNSINLNIILLLCNQFLSALFFPTCSMFRIVVGWLRIEKSGSIENLSVIDTSDLSRDCQQIWALYIRCILFCNITMHFETFNVFKSAPSSLLLYLLNIWVTERGWFVNIFSKYAAFKSFFKYV